MQTEQSDRQTVRSGWSLKLRVHFYVVMFLINDNGAFLPASADYSFMHVLCCCPKVEN